MVDARDGKAFDLVNLPVEQMAMKLPSFDSPPPLLTLSPGDTETAGDLPDSLVSLPPLDTALPETSQELVMGMRLDDKDMALFKQAGLMDMSSMDTMDAATIENVTKIIVDEPALTRAEQLSTSTINGNPFDLSVIPFEAPIHKNLHWMISEGDDNMLHPVHIHGCQFRILAIDDAAPPA